MKNYGEHARLLMARVELAMRHHPRVISGAVMTLLLGSGITAFGVAPLTAIDTTPVATRIVTESLAPQDLGGQLQALDELALTLHRTDLTRPSDTADTLLSRLGLHDPEAAEFLRRNLVAQHVLMGRPGKQIQARGEDTPGGGQLQELIARGPASDTTRSETHFNRITVKRGEHGLSVTQEDVAFDIDVRVGAGTIESSLFAAADEAGLPDAVTMQMAEIFGSDIDFRRELRKGDTFSVVYETLVADGQPVTWHSTVGRVMAARFINDGQTHEAVWFQDGQQRGSYYGPDGQSKNRVFLSSPLAFSRVSSGFALRFHPILKQWRAHLGVDYAAPTGTAVRSLGEGVVEFAGVQNGYGNVVTVRHAGERSTVYAHLSRIGVRVGQRVSQGENIGAVGSTGWATGPHLHFELKVGGRQVDPVKIARASESVELPAAAKPRFEAVASVARQRLTAGLSLAGAVARME